MAHLLWALVHLRYMFLGFLLGSVLGLIYKRLAHGPFDSGAGIGSGSGDDVLVITTVVFAVVGMALDIRRGLKN